MPFVFCSRHNLLDTYLIPGTVPNPWYTNTYQIQPTVYQEHTIVNKLAFISLLHQGRVHNLGELGSVPAAASEGGVSVEFLGLDLVIGCSCQRLARVYKVGSFWNKE
jgi:hypothetical protein